MYQSQLTADAPIYQLRPGMQGRHIFGPRSSLSDRCFEWTVHRDVGDAGLPLYCVSEFELDGSGFRKSSKVVKASSPYEVWNKLFTEVLELPPPNKGAQYCGFRDPSLAALLKLGGAAAVQQYELNPSEFVANQTKRWERDFAATVAAPFRRAMESVCPTDPHLAFQVLRRSASWQAEWYGDEEEYDDIIDLPFITGMVETYHAAPVESKVAILSLFAPYFTVDATSRLFGVSPYYVTQARLHDVDAVAGQPLVKKTQDRMSLSPSTFAFLHQ